MSPFLAEVNVINLTGDTHGTATSDDHTDALAELRANVAKIKANAAQIKADAIEKARRETAQALKEQSEEKGEDESEHTASHHGKSASFTLQTTKSKSNDEDMVFAAIPIVAIVFTFLYLIVRALMAPFTNRNKRGALSPVVMEGLSAEETAILEKLQRTLAQMESRVESLETILIDPTRTKEKYGSKL